MNQKSSPESREQNNVKEINLSSTESIKKDAAENSADVLSGVTDKKRRNLDYTHLSEEEKDKLWESIKSGDINARNLLIELNQKLVWKVVNSFTRSNNNFDKYELFQEGSIGLIRAADKFDPDGGNAFSTYAVSSIISWIRNSIIRKNNPVYLSVNDKRKLFKVKRFVENFFAEKDRFPTVEEVYQQFDMKKEEIKEYMKLNTPTYKSLDDEIYNKDGSGKLSLKDIIPSEENIEEKIQQEDSERKIVEDTFSCLLEREKEILMKRYGFYGTEIQSLQSLGNEYSTSRERMRQIEQRALRKIKKKIIDEGSVSE